MEIKEELTDKPINQDVIKTIELMGLSTLLGEDWALELYEEFPKSYMQDLSAFIQKERKTKTIFPPQEDVFNAFKSTNLKDVKIVVIGQDCYHGENQAHGLSFSVKDEIRTPPSLNTIFKAVEKQIYDGFKMEQSNNLERWAKQGVFLLNNILTVEKNKPLSHKDKGWETFTDRVIEILNKQDRKICFLLFGKEAQTKCNLVDKTKHLVIETEHPAASLYSNREWRSEDCFKKASEFVSLNYNYNMIW